MNDYLIFTDSNADLTPEMIAELDIRVIPMQFTISDKDYLDYPDHKELAITDFYAKMREGNMCTTIQLNPNDFREQFTPSLEEGRDLIYIAFSSGLSGTYASACMAAEELKSEYPGRKIVIVDSLAASMGEGLLIWHAAMKKREGLSIEELEQWVVENRNHLCHWFTVDDLFHLKRGGRVSAAAAVIGSALGIKPGAPCGRRRPPDSRQEGARTQAVARRACRNDGADRNRPAAADGVHQSRRLARGCEICRKKGARNL